MADYCRVSRSMVFFHLNEKRSLPRTIAEKLCDENPNLNRFLKNEFYELSFNRKNNNAIKLPETTDEKLAEFVGELLGDGHSGSKNYEISVTGDRLNDSWYVKNHVAILIETLFGMKPSIYEQKNPGAVRCKFYSKQVLKFLVENLGMQVGKKRYNKNLKIPPVFFDDEKLLKACLRGLFDTDGGFYRHHKHSAIVEICNYNDSLLKSVHEAFDKLGFKVSLHCEGIWLFRRDQILRFSTKLGVIIQNIL